MRKIGVIGSHETVMGFRALGLETFAAASGEEAREILRRILREETEFAILYIEETLAPDLHREIAKCKDRPDLAIILIPGREGSTGLGRSALHEAVERAVGTDILSNDKKGK